MSYAITASPQPALADRSWDDEIVPALRQRKFLELIFIILFFFSNTILLDSKQASRARAVPSRSVCLPLPLGPGMRRCSILQRVHLQEATGEEDAQHPRARARNVQVLFRDPASITPGLSTTRRIRRPPAQTPEGRGLLERGRSLNLSSSKPRKRWKMTPCRNQMVPPRTTQPMHSPRQPHPVQTLPLSLMRSRLTRNSLVFRKPLMLRVPARLELTAPSLPRPSATCRSLGMTTGTSHLPDLL